MKRIGLLGLAALVLIPAALFLYMRFEWDAENGKHASVEMIAQFLEADQVTEIGPIESDLLETPRLYGYWVEKDGQRHVAVFEREFGKDKPYLLILPGQPLSEADRQAQDELESALADQESLQILSRHQVIRVQGGERKTLPQPFYKVTFQSNQASYLVFYQDEPNKISAFENGYDQLKGF
ncbi:hypothetical protein CBW65_04180 [Tumebacillus avium]|uniref:Uncharacterized protein n=1 Tax=Tumebacillus avium TaxID=1903704 RepID=A0A1Y0IJU5_9BACL|nr:hypothetical protein [Tumebacillus avium]ARU60349.1 hypothetical protein CBW65_04180 [Tumebacillus avium]